MYAQNNWLGAQKTGTKIRDKMDIHFTEEKRQWRIAQWNCWSTSLEISATPLTTAKQRNWPNRNIRVLPNHTIWFIRYFWHAFNSKIRKQSTYITKVRTKSPSAGFDLLAILLPIRRALNQLISSCAIKVSLKWFERKKTLLLVGVCALLLERANLQRKLL